MSKSNRKRRLLIKDMSRAAAKRLRERKMRSRKARLVKRRAKPVGVNKLNIEPLRKRLLGLCKQWRAEQREITKAAEVGNQQAVTVHEQNRTRIEHEMRRIMKVFKVLPLANGGDHGQK